MEHRRAFGADAPFIVCDPRRGNTPASVRSPANVVDAAAAFNAAVGGSLCIRRRRPPREFSSLDEFHISCAAPFRQHVH
jgi:hypothetical protein